MKTAISIIDPIFNEAEHLAAELGMSRSEFYTTAVAKLIASYRDEQVTKCLNKVYESESSQLDPAFVQLQNQTVKPEEW